MRDIPKYSSAGAFGEAALSKWQEFLDEFESKYGSTPDSDSMPWLLDSLPKATSPVPPPALNVPEKISELHRAEAEPPAQVQKHTHYHTLN